MSRAVFSRHDFIIRLTNQTHKVGHDIFIETFHKHTILLQNFGT